MKMRETSPYEVLCPRCNVTFPVGTRHCIHCGGPVGRGRGLFSGATTTSPADRPEEIDELDDVPRRSPFSPVALLWVILLGAGAIYRACTGT